MEQYSSDVLSKHHDFFLNALAQGKVHQVVHILRIKHLGELLLLYKLKGNLRRLEIIQKFLYWLKALCVPRLIKFPQRALRFVKAWLP